MTEDPHVPEEDLSNRKKRKDEAKLLKRKRIEDAGGVRPRVVTAAEPAKKSKKKQSQSGTKQQQQHRFGRVMESVPCRNKPRYSTTSIALPGSVVSNCQTRELKTLLVGQIARAATIYHVDEIIVFDDKLAIVERKGYYNNSRQNRRDNHHGNRRGDNNISTTTHENRSVEQTNDQEACTEVKPAVEGDRPKRSDPHTFMARVLQYCECPQYLRRNFFPMHPDLQFTGLLSPIDAPHHVRQEDRCKYREGVVMDRKGSAGKSLVNCGIRNRPVEIDRVLMPGIRCTVQLNVKAYGSASQIKGTVVAPCTPREDNGTYWGYTTRLAHSIHDVFDSCPYEGGYDLKIGTSERGDSHVDSPDFGLSNRSFRHALIVFGGVAGIEECVDADESMKIPGAQSKTLFDEWINTCPYQGSRTIRTEEAVLLSLARLSPHLASNHETKNNTGARSRGKQDDPVDFSDKDISDESDDDSGDDDDSEY